MGKVQHLLPEIGDRHGRLVVIAEAVHKQNTWFIQCRCDCDTLTNVRHQHWVSGHTRSCGCLQRETSSGHLPTAKTPPGWTPSPALFAWATEQGILIDLSRGRHGMTRTRLYYIWGNMIARCTNSKNVAWASYGGRGITVCDSWRTFLPFADWAINNGYAANLEIDRENNDGNYEPENCRWVIHQVNSMNRRPRTRRRVVVDGKRQCNVCRKWKILIEAFAKDASDWSGYRKTCKVCQRKLDQARWTTTHIRTRASLRTSLKGLGKPKAGQRKDSVILRAFGEEHPMSYWANDSRCVVSYTTLHYRVKHGWKHETAITTPPG